MKMTYFQIERRLSHRLRISVAILILTFLTCFNMVYGQGVSNYSAPLNLAEMTADEILYNVNQPGDQGSREVPDGFPYPPTWERPESSRVEPHFLIVNLQANPRIGDIPIQQGDYVGAFFVGDNGALVCGGAGYWKADSTIIFAITGDDPQTTHKEGFSYGAVINYRLFSFTTMKDYTVTTISFDTSPGSGFISGVKWYPLALSSAINVKANVTFDAYATATPNPICIGGSSQLNANIYIGPGEPYTYNWTSNPAGFTSTLKNPVVTPGSATQYLLTAYSGALTSQHNVTMVVNGYPVANAGTDGTVCGNQTYQLTGTAQNYLAVQWATTGSGTFDDTTSLNPIYTPGSQDVSAGQISLILEAQPLSPCNVSDTDLLSLTVLPIPIIAAGSDKQACGNDQILLNATAQNYGAIQWTASGTGSFTQPTSLQTQYMPSTADISNGAVTLTVCASSVQPCAANICDALIVSFLPGPTASAPATKVICENLTANLTGSASNYSSTLWTTAGDGTFNNPNALAISYTPGPNDKINGVVTLTFNVFPLQPCTTTATKQTVVTVKRLPVVNAGTTDLVCKNTSLQLNGTATSYNGLIWSSLGDGTFSNPNILNPLYFPGINDNAAGTFKLVLKGTASLPCSLPDYDTLQVTIVNNASVQINTQNNLEVCQTPAFQLDAQANSYNQLQWTTNGDGTFNNASILNPLYTAGPVDVASGLPVNFTLTAFAISPCSVNAQSSISATFIKLPDVNAGSDASICEGSTHQLSGTANNYASLSWSTSGTGTFSSTTTLNPVYTPGASDISTGTVTLTLTALPNSPCAISATDINILSIQKNPVANAGTDATICQTSTHQLSGSAQYQNSVLWSTSGTGTFSSTSSLTPVYTPGAADITAGTVTLTLIASAKSPCTVSNSDTKILTIQKSPTANAGSDATICQTETHPLSGTAQNQSSVLWITTGTGTFSSTSSLTPVYTPGAADITTGTVTLTLTSSATSPCTVAASDAKILTIQKTPTANAGSDATICQTSTHQLSATAQNQSSVLWTTSGTGTFSSTNSLTPVYSPSAADITAGLVTLTLTASATLPCATSVSDSKTISIQKSPIANAGTDATICQGNTHTLAGTALNQSSVLWTTSGTGTFSSVSSLTPVYTPGADDISAGTVILTLTASATSPCTLSSSDNKILNIQKTPVADAGIDATIIQGYTHELLGTAGNYQTILWTTSGTGTFSSASSLTPVYAPGAADIEAGMVSLTLTASAISPCTVAVSDSKTLTIQKFEVDAVVTPNPICTGSSAQLSAVVLVGSGGPYIYSWTSNPAGFTSPLQTINVSPTQTTKYYLMGYDGLLTSVDSVTLDVYQQATANAGTDATVCQTNTHQLNGSAQNNTSVLWTTSGSGTFSSASSLTPVYTPGAADITAGTVTLTLTASAVSPCTLAATDNKILIIRKTPVASAGADATICQTATHQLTGFVQNQSSILWSTSGNGTFSNPNIASPVYTPGATDISNGSVTLTITAAAVSPCTVAATDNKILVIRKSPIANAGTDATICQTETHQLSGSAQNNSTVLWATSGNGTFSSTSSLTPVYSPGTNDISLGTVTLTMTASAVSPCTVSASDSKILVIQKSPTANAGNDATICEGSTHTLAGTAQNQSSVLWTTSGTGTFSSTSTLTPVYSPSSADITAGTLTLTMTSSAVSPCTVSVSDNKILIIQKSPIANAGADATICQTETHLLSGSAQNQSSVLWTTSGNGTFSSTSSLTPVYTPGTTDISLGTVTLTMTASAVSPCAVSASDSKVLVIQKSPTANAGSDATICQGTTHTLAGTAQNQSSVLWATSGTGTFSSISSLIPVYTPGAADITAGTVTLTMTASAVSPCTVSVSDSKILVIQKLPTANAGIDATICQGSTHTLNGTAQNQSSVLWTTAGTGTFSSTSSLTPVYTPGAADISAGTVTLTMTSSAVSPCTVSTSDNKILVIQKLPTTNAGIDATICQTATHTLTGTAQNQSSILWTTSGNGTFSSTTALSPVYTPGTTDVTNGTVTLTLTASALSPCTVSSSDSKILVIQKSPVANAGADATICQTETHQLSGSAQNQTTVLWATSGNGTFSSISSLTPIYTPGTTDILDGSVMLTFTATAVLPCSVSSSDSKILIIQKSPTANAGSDATICQTEIHQLAGSAQQNTGVIWTTAGDGTFSSTSSLSPDYTAGSADVAAGSVILTMTATAISPCTVSSSDNLTLVIQKSPVADAGSDATISEGTTHQLAGTAQNNGLVLWTTIGDGTFSSTSSLTPAYTPGVNDNDLGSVTLTLTVAAISPCAVSAADSKILYIQNFAVDANANPNPICIGGSAQLSANVLIGSGGPYTFTWTSIPAGFSSSEQNPVVIPTQTTQYFLTSQDGMFTSFDNITLTVNNLPTTNSGNDATICATETHQLSGSAQNNSGYIWTTSGNGTFSNATILNPVYTPGTGDISSGSVTLTLTANPISPCTFVASDSKVLTIRKTPVANAGIDVTICQGSAHTLSGSAQNQSSVLWTTSGNGTFGSAGLPTTVYTPGATDISAGIVTLTFTASAVSPCIIAAVDTKILAIQKTPTANAGTDASICQGNVHQLSGTAQNNATVAWTTSGNGTFSSASSLTPVYTPGTTDVTNGTVTLTLTASAISPCTISAVDTKILIIQKTPTAFAGIDASICVGSALQLAATSQNSTSLAWTTSGTGTFNSTSSLTPVYTPGAADIEAGNVTLTLAATAISPCESSASDNMMLTIQKTPSANAGTDATICQTVTHQLSGAAQNGAAVLWTTSGNGTFSSASSLTPVYTSGTADITAGTVTLTLTASPISPCSVSAFDTKMLVIQKAPVVDAGTDATISDGTTHQLTGIVENSGSFAWSTSGDGSFSSTTILNPVYTPGFGDTESGIVTLTLSASAVSPCTVSVSDSKILTIQKFLVDASVAPVEICFGGTAQLFANVVVGSGGPYTFNWATIPAGFASTEQNPVVNPFQTTEYFLTAYDGSVVSRDSVTLVVTNLPVSDAGADAAICEGSTHQLSGTAQNYAGLLWSTSGNGTFSSASSLTPVYTPGTVDILAGTVTLTLKAVAISPCTIAAEDHKIVVIQNKPVANAGTDATICQGSTHHLTGTADHYQSVIWSTSGSGSFSNTTILDPVYNPGPSDITAGTVTLTLTASAISPCTVSATDSKVLQIQKLPIANAGNDATICQTGTHQLSGTVQYQSSVLWTTSGNGIFSSASSLTAVYTPGTSDISLGAVTLTLTAIAVSPCQISSSDTKILVVRKTPLANAGLDATISQGNTHQLSATAQNYSAVSWITSGTGSFSNANILNPVYTPSAADIEAGMVSLTLTSSAISPCTVSATDSKNLTILKFVVDATASPNPICIGGSAQLAAIVVVGNGPFTYTWTSNPSGFSSYIENPVANPVITTKYYVSVSNGISTAQDSVTLIVNELPMANAGIDGSVCDIQNYNLNGSAQNYSSVSWATSGNGTFSSTSALTPVYTPGTQDLISGQVTLSLTAVPLTPCTMASTDNMILFIVPDPTVNAGIDQTVCSNEPIILTAQATNFATIQWVASIGSGTFSNPTSVTTQYTPSTNDISRGYVNLTVTVNSGQPCAKTVSDLVKINFLPGPAASAPPTKNICENQTASLTATASRYSSTLWTTAGDGTFNNPNALAITYTPGPNDRQNGTVTVTFSAFPIAPCLTPEVKQTVITIKKLPVANAGNTDFICRTSTSLQLNGSVNTTATYTWSTLGDGVFNNRFILNPIYFPGNIDKATGAFKVVLKANATLPCTTSIFDTDTLQVTFIDNPTVQITTPNNQEVCQTPAFQLAAQATSFSMVNWTTTGDGTFSSTSSLTPVYTPGTNDVANGAAVKLTLTVSAIAPCSVNAQSNIFVNFKPNPVANAGADATICEGSTYQLSATAQHYGSVLWETSGNGTFSSTSSLTPVYTPGTADIITGNVTLTITTDALSPCTGSVSDSKILVIQKLPVINAGSDIAACGPTMLNGFGSDYDNLLWATSGDGTFDNLNILTPVYAPGTNDILTGNVELSLTALALSPCAVSSTDVVILSVDYPVVISDLVTDQDLNAGDELQQTFLAQSQTAGVYRWYHNNVLIIGENASVLSIQNVAPSDAGYYYCVYSTDCGEVTSGTALISIFEAASMQLSLNSGWAGISTYVQPVPSDVSVVFGAIVNDVDIISNQYQNPPEIFWPLEGINTLGNWSATKGYKIKMINQAELTVTGKILYPSAPLSIPSGWSYLPVNSVCPVNVAEIFDSQTSVTMIKEIAGWRIYWPVQGVNTLQLLTPGKAYEILNSSGSSIQIQYPGCDGAKLNPESKSGEMKIQSPWNEIHHSSSTHVFGFTSQASASFEPGDIIGAFDQNDLNVGITGVISSDEPMAIATFSDDDMTIHKDGLLVGETVTFKIYRPSTQEVYELTAIYAENSPMAGNFAVNGISIIEKAEFKATSIGFIGSSDKVTLSVYPNPATSVINVSISSNNTINGTMMLMNANGQIVIRQQFAHSEAITRQQLDVSSVTKGVYYLKVVSDNILKVEKILIN